MKWLALAGLPRVLAEPDADPVAEMNPDADSREVDVDRFQSDGTARIPMVELRDRRPAFLQVQLAKINESPFVPPAQFRRFALGS